MQHPLSRAETLHAGGTRVLTACRSERRAPLKNFGITDAVYVTACLGLQIVANNLACTDFPHYGPRQPLVLQVLGEYPHGTMLKLDKHV